MALDALLQQWIACWGFLELPPPLSTSVFVMPQPDLIAKHFLTMQRIRSFGALLRYKKPGQSHPLSLTIVFSNMKFAYQAKTQHCPVVGINPIQCSSPRAFLNPLLSTLHPHPQLSHTCLLSLPPQWHS